MIHTLKNFLQLINDIPKILNESHYKKMYIIKKTGMSHATFYRKLKDKTFTVDELFKLAQILEPVEYYNYELEQSLKRGEEDIKAGRVENWEDVKKELMLI